MVHLLLPPAKNSQTGSATQVLLATQFHAAVGQKYAMRGPNSSHDRPRCVSRVWIATVQEKRTYSQGQTKSSLQGMGRRLVASPEDHIIAFAQRTLTEHLLREPIPLRGMCWAVVVSLTELLHFMIECFATCPEHL